MSVPRRRRALLIGNEIHHNDRWARLPSARVDRDELRAVLSEPTIGGFDVEVLADLDALRMRAAITNFCQESVDDELLLLYVSGHGAVRPDGEFAFVATDTDPHDLTGTGISATFVNNCLEDSYAAQKVALFDTCQSGAFTSGFRTRPTKGVSTTPLTRTAPVRPRGVYVLASSDVDEYSFSGPIDESGNPTASVFTDAVVKVLSSGSAGTTGGGFVSVDDLYDAVHQRLLGLEPPQTPLKSSDHVVGSIVIAARPSGRTSAESRVGEEASARSFAATAPESDDDAGVAPDWSRLLGYYADIVRADTTRPGLMAVGGDDYVDLTGSERVLRGVLDPDGTVPVPEGADALIESARSEHGPTLWAGWPTVVLHRSAPSGTQSGQPLCAPLLIRRVEVVDDGGAVRLRPISDVVPHPGLVSSCLEEDEAARLLWSYRPSWHFGESARMATDADQLLRDPFGLPSVEQLRPEHLAGRVDIATPGEGARNAAILFGLPTSSAAKGLLKDYVQIIARPTSIAGTALAALHPDTSTDDVPKAEVSLVTPLPGNDAQEAVIRCAMTRRLTVATGPPGTGKSQLVVDTVATATAAGQSVLVASTNNTAVDEVVERCHRIAPGFVVRTGNRAARQREQAIVAGLLRAQKSAPDVETRHRALRAADRSWSRARDELDTIARRENELLAAERACHTEEVRLRADPAPFSRAAPPSWVDRAASLAKARWFGDWRRRRFLRSFIGADTADHRFSPLGRFDDADKAAGDTSQICAALGRWGKADRDRTRLRELVGGVDDLAVQSALTEAETRRATWGRALTADVVARRARDGHRQIRELQQASASDRTDWGEFRRALPYLPAWASTSLAARRFPIGEGLFDLVVIDEASQCTIPSIVPLLYRAKRALVIGDPMQLSHITNVDPGTDATLRSRWKVPRAWLSEHRLSPVRHSAFAAAEQRSGPAILLDEHYRCHPDIAGVVNRLFYKGRLTVFTDPAAPGRVRLPGPALRWRDVAGHAVRGPSGRSWRNDAEATEIDAVLGELIRDLPDTATIGVVTPYRAQAELVTELAGQFGDRVQVGTAHKFQGGERDVMVLSLVAGRNEAPRRFDWIDQQPELWNVAITRARSRLVVVGDADLWRDRGGVGAELLDAASAAADAVPPVHHELDDDLADRLYEVLEQVGSSEVRLRATVDGHPVDGLLSDGRAVLVDDSGAAAQPGARLKRTLTRSRLSEAIRIPAWTLYGPRALELIERGKPPISEDRTHRRA
ncbi:DNA helicase [Pseudonocardia sp. Ae168_Ps1]|nr:DNA helicase [Pseudonocardia sp. Ae168_Ps1]OLL77098.1 DNA helicase [Pseudonocardia sp. Ae150A_Ps1]OLL88794.1 DNA helicase [Pseudonocardia sp. Ae263_Ps1]OLL91186.1 DNA helicase [Pseudonocardia sp. Ae356_Ps1]